MATEAQLLEPGAARTGLRWPDTMLEHEKKVPSFDQYADRDAPVIGGARPTEETEISRAPNYKVLSTKRRCVFLPFSFFLFHFVVLNNKMRHVFFQGRQGRVFCQRSKSERMAQGISHPQ